MTATLLTELSRARVLFQQRAIATHITGRVQPTCPRCGFNRRVCKCPDQTPTRDLLTAPDREGCEAVPPAGANAARDRASIIGVNGTEPGTLSDLSAVPILPGAGSAGHADPTGMASIFDFGGVSHACLNTAPQHGAPNGLTNEPHPDAGQEGQ